MKSASVIVRIVQEQKGVMKMNAKEFLLKYGVKYCANVHKAGLGYLNPDMCKLSMEAAERGEEWFYTKKVDGKPVLSEPEYMIHIQKEITPAEWEELTGEVVDKYVDKAKQLKRDCYHSAGCEVCHNEASDICNVLCEFDNKTLAELEDNTIANYLRMIEDANNKRKI